jgi:hypothetical protein
MEPRKTPRKISLHPREPRKTQTGRAPKRLALEQLVTMHNRRARLDPDRPSSLAPFSTISVCFAFCVEGGWRTLRRQGCGFHACLHERQESRSPKQSRRNETNTARLAQALIRTLEGEGCATHFDRRNETNSARLTQALIRTLKGEGCATHLRQKRLSKLCSRLCS